MGQHVGQLGSRHYAGTGTDRTRTMGHESRLARSVLVVQRRVRGGGSVRAADQGQQRCTQHSYKLNDKYSLAAMFVVTAAKRGKQ